MEDKSEKYSSYKGVIYKNDSPLKLLITNKFYLYPSLEVPSIMDYNSFMFKLDDFIGYKFLYKLLNLYFFSEIDKEKFRQHQINYLLHFTENKEDYQMQTEILTQGCFIVLVINDSDLLEYVSTFAHEKAIPRVLLSKKEK